MIEKKYLHKVRDNYSLDDIRKIYNEMLNHRTSHLMSPNVMQFWGDLIDDIREILPKQN